MRWRLILGFLAVILVTLVSITFSLQANTVNIVDDLFRRGENYGVETIVEALESHYAEYGNWAEAESLLETVIKGPGPTGQGNPTQSHSSQFQNRPQMSLSDPKGNILFGNGLEDLAEPFGEDILDYSIPLYHEETIVGYLIPNDAIFLTNINFSNTLSSSVTKAAINSVIIAGGVSILLAFLLSYFLLIPVRKLTMAAENLAQGDFSEKVEIKGSSEFVTLGETFNYLSESLQAAEKRRQAMTADVAHELRTPLAIQRANLEAMQDGVYPMDQENLTLILDQNEMLNKLVEDLRLLALSDANELRLTQVSVDINELVSYTLNQFKSQAEKKSINLTHAASDPVNLNADPNRVSQILNNLLSNALRHTPDNGEISISVLHQKNHVEINVKDSGSGFSEEVLENMFNRFYRGDSSRARDHGGSGLGLTIARRLAAAQGGNLVANNHPEGGAVFTLTLPKSSSL